MENSSKQDMKYLPRLLRPIVTRSNFQILKFLTSGVRLTDILVVVVVFIFVLVLPLSAWRSK